MTRLLFIHGINNENKTVDDIRSDWGSALNKGMRAAGLSEVPVESIECAYYAKLLAEGAEERARSRSIDRTRHAFESDVYRQFESELEEKFAPQARVEVTESTTVEVSDEARAQVHYPSDEGLSRSLDGVSSRSENLYDISQSHDYARAAGPHKGGLIAGAKLIEMISPKLAKALIGKFLKQSIAYLEDSELREQVNKAVVKQLFSDQSKKDEPHIVVTHSNGTLLSYFLFSEALKDWNIRAWYTIGSPLGAETMQSYIPRLDSYPGKVQTWYHCWDKEDFVSYDTPLTKDNIGIDGVVNINTFDTDEKDKHSIVSYLSHAMLARLIHQDFFNE